MKENTEYKHINKKPHAINRKSTVQTEYQNLTHLHTFSPEMGIYIGDWWVNRPATVPSEWHCRAGQVLSQGADAGCRDC